MKKKAETGTPFGCWPKGDQDLWSEVANPEPFDDDELPLGTWSPRHQDLARYYYGAWLAFLAQHFPEALDKGPGERATPERIRQFVGHAQSWLKPRTVAVGIINLKGVLDSFDPESDRSWMKPIVRRLERRGKATPPAPKPFCHSSVLLRIGEQLMRDACDAIYVIDPEAFRDGLIIALLASVPVRIHAFSLIRIDQHLRKQAFGGWTVNWEASETKGRREDNWSVPRFLVPWLDTYLDEVRPTLQKAGPTVDQLWIGVSGQPIGDQIIRKIIKRRTAQALGAPILPHAFRTSAATTFVLENPEHAIEASALLSHTDFSTTEKHYLAGRRQMAVQVAHQALRRLRRGNGQALEEDRDYSVDDSASQCSA
jgi:integrase/recombinase XerD